MSRRLTFTLAGVVFLTVALIFSRQTNRETQTISQFQADREVLEPLARQLLADGEISSEALPAPWTGAALFGREVPVVQFELGASGLGGSTVYWGVNFVPENTFVGYQGWRSEYWKGDGDGRMFYEPEGDDTCFVKKLDDCWYYYEMHF